MESKQDTDIEVTRIETSDLVRQALWGFIHGVEAQRAFAEMLIHSEGLEDSDAPTTEGIAHMVSGMADRLDLHLSRINHFISAIVDIPGFVHKGLKGLIVGISAQQSFSVMLVHSNGMDDSEAPTFEEVAHMVAGMADRLDMHLNHVKSFVFDRVGSVKP